MSLSGTQITRIGVLGSPGRAYLGFVAKAETVLADISFGIFSKISTAGTSILTSMTSDGSGVLSSIDDTQGIFSKMNSKGKSVFSTINSGGQSVESEL